MNLNLKTAVYFFSLILITLVMLYFLSTGLATVWFIGLLVMYWFSDDEPFWLAFFLVISDGFMSFFGPYEALLTVFPNMPAIELGHFYVILSIFKARNKNSVYPVFYKQLLSVMGIYLLFLIGLSIVIGVKGELNAYFRILK